MCKRNKSLPVCFSKLLPEKQYLKNSPNSILCLSSMFFLFCFWAIPGVTQGLVLTVLSRYSLSGSRDRVGCQGPNPAQPCANGLPDVLLLRPPSSFFPESSALFRTQWLGLHHMTHSCPLGTMFCLFPTIPKLCQGKGHAFLALTCNVQLGPQFSLEQITILITFAQDKKQKTKNQQLQLFPATSHCCSCNCLQNSFCCVCFAFWFLDHTWVVFQGHS